MTSVLQWPTWINELKNFAVRCTSDVENDCFADGGDSIEGTAQIDARIGAADVGDDQQSSTVVLGPACW